MIQTPWCPAAAGESNSDGSIARNCWGELASAPLPEEGLEPSPCCQDGILNPARLPIPPLRLVDHLRCGHSCGKLQHRQSALEVSRKSLNGMCGPGACRQEHRPQARVAAFRRTNRLARVPGVDQPGSRRGVPLLRFAIVVNVAAQFVRLNVFVFHFIASHSALCEAAIN